MAIFTVERKKQLLARFGKKDAWNRGAHDLSAFGDQFDQTFRADEPGAGNTPFRTVA